MNEELPPPNRAIGWYRFMLWMMPTCIAISTIMGFAWMRYHGDEAVLVWFAVNGAATYGIGAFESKLRRPPSRNPAGSAVAFLALQFLIVPAVSCALLFALCVVGVA